jgi:hypothetical protein
MSQPRGKKAKRSQRSSANRNRDRALVSDESYEVEYLHRKFPDVTHRQLVAALGECKSEMNGSEDRRKIMSCLRKKLE